MMSSVITFQDIRAESEQNEQLTLDDDLFDDDDEYQQGEDDNLNGHKQKDSKSKKRNRKKKSNKPKNNQNHSKKTLNGENSKVSDKENDNEEEKKNEDQIEIEFVPEEISLDKNYAEFTKVFEYFKLGEGGRAKQEEVVQDTKNLSNKAVELERLKKILEDEDEEEKDKNEKKDELKLSKKQLKKQTRLSVAALKQLVNRPDVVEMHDVTAQDPKLLVHLKAVRNTVQVPRHWCAKRKYLQGKRGFEKPAFDLPDFIKRTGIQTMREAVAEKEQNKSLKQKMREKIRPKMGKIDIDYQKLHDAFFRWQTKPRMSIHGDLYYEGKELETKLKEKKPGNLTDDLRIALGMPTGPNADKMPPPWLIAMQRYGPPPSYPSLKIPGLNAPIPEGCSFGYHAGGWGKPPVDEFGRPLYGDVFGSAISALRKPEEEEEVDKELWGEMEDEVYEEIMPGEDEEEEEEEEVEKEKGEEDEEEAAEGEDLAGLKTPGEGLMTPSGISTTVSAGLETPDMIELRKRKTQIEAEMEAPSGEIQSLYKILPEKATSVGSSMMGSSKIYDISAAKSGLSSDIDIALNPDELDMSSEVLQSRYDQYKQGESLDQEDLDDQQKQAKKRKKQQQQAPTSGTASSTGTSSTTEKNKKHKDFKF